MDNLPVLLGDEARNIDLEVTEKLGRGFLATWPFETTDHESAYGRHKGYYSTTGIEVPRAWRKPEASAESQQSLQLHSSATALTLKICSPVNCTTCGEATCRPGAVFLSAVPLAPTYPMETQDSSV